MVAVDSCILIDLLGGDARAQVAEQALRDALSRGPVVVCDVVVGEVVSGLGYGAELLDTLEGAGITFSAIESRSAVRAGEMQRRYKERRKAAALPAVGPRTVPDFLIGAHALLQCRGLITRDAGFFRDYFKGLKVIVPQAD
ncbi:MAG: type II toxin-antitoxin system VapC family toxin [Gammaproteobacteria bacterium]|uniref:type II toxin-antitoxin system VapC family toxin n=1 Tax=Azohydromonas sp. TaxID=1872666 RepID=UPI002BC74330|nr:type II toxin-antitoxin system VapC family toxin [Azohydromonas sp.]HMM84092.1 type II toxin-antitoxin system VapC family toxin [Azohydromonas sp.]